MKIGMIGLGDMGKLYAKTFAKAGLKVAGCDLPDRKSALVDELSLFGINVLDDAKEVANTCDFIFYAVEAEKIDEVVKQTAAAIKDMHL